MKKIVLCFCFLFLIGFVVAAGVISEPSYCCEKTKSGAWCLNDVIDNCNPSFSAAPTSCESTAYCRLGTCYESDEGICMPNTPQRTCISDGGTWDERTIEEVPQCQLGCCVIADQAAFVPLVRCKKLSTLFGVENDYRTDIDSEVECIATAQSQDVGACVYEKDFERVCEFTTRGDCGANNEVETINDSLSSEKTFYKDWLCSAEELNTACARQTYTVCYQGDVYWADSCWNRENVYSSDKVKSWNNGRVLDDSEVCPPNDGSNINCGNCDYLLGTRCAEWDSYLGGPSDGDNYCKLTECVDREGDPRFNGESWCVRDEGYKNGGDRVGSRYFREICIDGEIRVEACADFRNEICLDDSIKIEGEKDFGTAACRVNRWQDCILHKDREDCIDIDRRDCLWLPAVNGMVLGGVTSGEDSSSKTYSNPSGNNSFSNPTAPVTGNVVMGIDDGKVNNFEGEDGVCVPNFPPGLEFWKNENAQQICGQANAKCVVVYEEGLIGGKDCVENCECLEDKWALDANRVCAALGDCGGYVNYQGVYTDDGYKWVEDKDDKQFSPNTINTIKGGFTARVVSAITGMASVADAAAEGAAGTGGLAPGQEAYFENQKNWMSRIFENSEYVPVGKTAVPAGDGFNLVEASASGAPGANPVFEGGQAKLAKMLNLEVGGAPSALVSGLQWAAIAYMAAQMLGSMFGLSDTETEALSYGLASGAFTYQFISTYNFPASFTANPVGGFIATNPALIGLGVGVVVFALTYKDEEIVIVEYNCMPWQAPTGGNECEVCNDDNLPCSEYRCKSLGQNCELVNAGTEQETCVNVNPQDVNPPVIKPNYADLTPGHTYTNVKNSPPGPGFTIVKDGASDGCLKVFTPLEFGIETDEPAQCKIDFNHTTAFDDMRTYMGGSNLYEYNHTERFSLPSAAALKNSSLILENGKDMTFFIRCQDKNGNENEAEYAVKFCVDPTPDSTAPRVEATSIVNGGCVAEDQDNVQVNFYTNEPAECRWSPQDQDFESMQGTMSCSNQIYQANALQLYTCSAELTGIPRDNADFYVRCKDYAEDRNTMRQSYKFSLRGSTGLKLLNLRPNETIFGGTNPSPVELYVETRFGCNNGQSICFYSLTGENNDYIQFYDTNNADGISTQRLDLIGGDHKIYVKCADEGGNLVEDIAEFTLDVDTSAPVVARIYEEDELLKLVTVRDSECAYTFDNCDFTFEEGTEMPYPNSTIHITEWVQDKTYYIKCRDRFRNEDADCSVVVRPTRNLFE